MQRTALRTINRWLVQFASITFFLTASHALANPVPLELPAPDNTAPATDKPVKVYIVSGQSNSVGFGKVSKAPPVYESLFLSADPRIKTGRMPVGESALLPLKVYQSADPQAIEGATAFLYEGAYDASADYSTLDASKEAKVALGNVDEQLPEMNGPQTVVVRGFIEVPMSGPHRVHAGFESSAQCIASIDGKEAYRKDGSDDPVITPVNLEAGKRHALTVTYLQGGSAAFWMERINLEGKGDLETLVTKDGKFTWMMNEDGQWAKRNDVILCDAYLGKGKAVPLSADWRQDSFGPELGFGFVMGTFHDEPVIVIKSDIGNRSLAWDVLPPGSERYTIDGTTYAGYKDTQSSWPEGQEPAPGNWYAGKQYDEYTQAVHDVLNNFDENFPQFKDQGYEIAGFVWWQGHKDQNPVHASRYEQNLVNLIKAWRKEFDAPDAKFAIATIAFDGWNLGEPGVTIANAQLAVSGETGKHPEFEGNVKTVEARHFWRGIGESPKSQGYHYNHNAETYMLVGDALGRAMVEMLGGEAEARPVPPIPSNETKTWPDEPTLAEAREMIFSDTFISRYAKDPAKPTAEDYAAMAPALKPIIVDKLIPEYVNTMATVPAYRRGGRSIVPLVTLEPPAKMTGELDSQYDRLLEMYEAAGVDAYRWKRFGPEMQTAKFHYLTFDPPETRKPGEGDRYREVTIPSGSDDWIKPEFNPAEAGWSEGQAPFGQVNGEKAALRERCGNPQCACDVEPNTFWDKEVLLMRQTFKLPKLDESKRYRLVVGGGGHTWEGEGFALYVDGELFAEATGGSYKNGVDGRGNYVFENFLPKFADGEVTIALKGFLRQSGHRGKAAPPRGHLSVWIEEATLPKIVVKAIEEHVDEQAK